jgi:Skp family chaperone for outer membrane proteins
MNAMNRQSYWIVALAVIVMFSGLVTLHGQSAVVDVQRVLNGLAEKNVVEADITRRGEQLQKQTQEKAKEVRDLEQDLSILGPDSEAYRQTNEKRQEKTIALEVWQRLKLQELETEKALQMEHLYRKLTAAVERLAKKQGYDLVLYKDETESLRAKTQQQVGAIISMRKVLYSAPELDLTDQLTQMLNNEFNNKK